MGLQKILSDSTLSPMDRLVLIALVMLREKGKINQSNEEIAGMVGSTFSTVSRSIKFLSEQNYISVVLVKNYIRELIPQKKMPKTLYQISKGGYQISNPPLTNEQRGYQISKGVIGLKRKGMLHPFIKYAKGLSNTQRGVAYLLKGMRVQKLDRQFFIPSFPFFFNSKKSIRSSIYIYYYNINILKLNKNLVYKNASLKIKKFEVVQDEKGISTCLVLRKLLGDYYNKNKTLYPPKMYADFLKYFSVPNKKGVPKWYREFTSTRGTFDIPMRLSTWNERNYNNLPNGSKNGITNKGGVRSTTTPIDLTGTKGLPDVEIQ